MAATGSVPPRPVRVVARVGARAALRMVLATRGGIGATNAVHRVLPIAQKRRLFYLLFEERCRTEGVWTVMFGGRRIRLPLRRDFHPSWDAALGFHGHDLEIHQFYEWLVRSLRRPRVVFDVGANYGVHALRFLVHGIRTVAFEPNTACHAYFQEACALNGVTPDIRAVVLADRPGSAQLWIPERQTCLATIMPEVHARWRGRTDVTAITVAQTTLDRFIAEHGTVPDLVKIDTEGSELAVLRGGRGLLERHQPLVVFESWPASVDRAPVFGLLAAAGYEVQALGDSFREMPGASESAFLESPANNFLARPRRSLSSQSA